MEIRTYIDFFISLLDYPTLRLVDKTVKCINVMEKESQEGSSGLADFLDYLFDTPMSELELSFSRSPHMRGISSLHQCFDKYCKGMVNSKYVETMTSNEISVKADFKRFIRNLSEMSSVDDLNFAISNFIYPSLLIIIDQFNKSILKAVNHQPSEKVSHEYLLKFRSAFMAIYTVIDQHLGEINAQESNATITIVPSVTIKDSQIEISQSFMCVS